MHIENYLNNGKPYLRLAEGYSIIENGKRKQKKRVIKSIGPLDRFDDGKPDYLKRLRQSFKDKSPLIPELLEFCDNNPKKEKITIEFDPLDDSDVFSNPKNISNFLLTPIFESLGISDVLRKYKSSTKIKYDLDGLTKLLAFGRILNPESKLATFRHKDDYLFSLTSSNNVDDVYHSLDILDKLSPAIQKRMDYKISNQIGRNKDLCFYDVTNYYFETDYEDDDILDENGEVLKPGLRKKGYSKENRRTPIVQMGLFIDDNGIPISYHLFPGRNNDITTLKPALEAHIDSIGYDKVIVVADGGMNSGKNITHMFLNGNGYVLSKSVWKSGKDIKGWVIDSEGYKANDDKTFKVKSKIQKRQLVDGEGKPLKDENGKKITINEKIVCFWSKKHYEKQKHEHENFLEYLERVAKEPTRMNGKSTKKAEKYLVKHEVDKKTGEIIETQTNYSIDYDKLNEQKEMLGYYTILTSETEWPDEKIIEKYRGLSRIEDSFRIVKSDLEGRPVYVRTPERINAHFLICFIALTIVRLIQCKVLEYQGKSTLNSAGWESGITAKNLQRALNSFTADLLPKGYCRFKKPTKDLELVLNSFGIVGDFRMPSLEEITNLKNTIRKQIVTQTK